MVRPLQHRVLIKPTPPPETSAGGLRLLPSSVDRDTSGTVVAVGRGPASAHRVRSRTIRHCVALLDAVACTTPADRLYQALLEAFLAYDREIAALSELTAGMTVCFPTTAGVRIRLDGSDDTYVLMMEDEIGATVDPGGRSW